MMKSYRTLTYPNHSRSSKLPNPLHIAPNWDFNWDFRHAFVHLCIRLCSFHPSLKHSGLQKNARPLQTPAKHQFHSKTRKQRSQRRQKQLTATLLPWTRIPTTETPLPRTRLGRPRLFLHINILKKLTRHVQPQLPHVPKAPRDAVGSAWHEIPVGEPTKEIGLARVWVGHELGLTAVRREPASQDVFPLGCCGVGGHCWGGEGSGRWSREGRVRRAEHEDIGKVGVVGLLPLREK